MSILLRPAWTQRSSKPRRLAPKRGPASRMAAPLIDGNAGLRLTEWLMLAVLAWASFLSISQPLFGIQLHHTFLNHTGLIFMLPVLGLHFVGVKLNDSPVPWGPIARVAVPFVLLAAFMLVGSAVARFAFEVKESYLALGAYLMLLPLYMAAVADGQRVRQWAGALIVLWVLVSLAATAGEVVRPGAKESLHEIEYLVTVGFFTLYYAVRLRLVKLLALVLMVAAALLNQKLTGYLVVSLALLHIVVAAGWRRVSPANRPLYVAGAVTFCLILATVLALLYVEFRQHLPGGNVEVRTKQYEQAMLQFFDSPVWGAAYLEGSGEVLMQGMRALNIPTHSDVLDLLKHGGLIAFTLFVWGYWQLFRLVNRAVRATTGERVLNAYFVGARFLVVTALLTFSFNPLLLKGPFLIVIWCNLGLAAGLAIGVLARPALATAFQPTRIEPHR